MERVLGMLPRVAAYQDLCQQTSYSLSELTTSVMVTQIGKIERGVPVPVTYNLF